MDPVLIILAASSGAAAASALGVLPLLRRGAVSSTWLGWSNAAAAGLMLAGAFVLFDAAVDVAVVPFGIGAVAGIAFIALSHLLSGSDEHEFNQPGSKDPAYGYAVLMDGSLHSSAEGVAFGAAMAVDPAMGMFLALVMAVHNVPEGTLLGAVFASRGVRLGRAALLAVFANVTQVLFGVTTYAVVQAAPAALPWALGFAAGALVYLVMVDLLPESYRQAGATSIALVTILAMGLFALMHAWLQGAAP